VLELPLFLAPPTWGQWRAGVPEWDRSPEINFVSQMFKYAVFYTTLFLKSQMLITVYTQQKYYLGGRWGRPLTMGQRRL